MGRLVFANNLVLCATKQLVCMTQMLFSWLVSKEREGKHPSITTWFSDNSRLFIYFIRVVLIDYSIIDIILHMTMYSCLLQGFWSSGTVPHVTHPWHCVHSEWCPHSSHCILFADSDSSSCKMDSPVFSLFSTQSWKV